MAIIYSKHLHITLFLWRFLLCAALLSYTACQSKAGEDTLMGTDDGSDTDTGEPVTSSPCLGINEKTDDCGGLLPTRIEGVAPLFVFFEPTFDPERTAFRTRTVHWQFGDDNAGRWSTTGGNKNTHTGPIAAHVYEEPGIYLTTATTVGPDGSEITQTATITVTDPEDVFLGESTICVSQTANFAGAPAGCRQVQTDNIDEVSAYIQPQTRILFRRSESWSISRGLKINVSGPGLIGAFGEGENPVFNVSEFAFSFGDRTPLTANDWRITDLQIIGVGSSANAIGLSVQTNNLLLHRLTIRNVHSGVSAGDSILAYWNDEGEGPHNLHDGVALSELDVRGIVGDNGGNGVYLVGRRMAAMGCSFDDSTLAEHIWRMPHIENGLLVHNVLSKANPAKHLLKLHGPKFDGGLLGNGRYTEQVQISDNIFVGAVEAWPVTIGPQNEASDERVRDILLERNHFVAGPSNMVMATLWAQSATVRNNLFDLSGATGEGDVFCAWSSKRGIEPDPANIDIYNNTCYSGIVRSVILARLTSASASSVKNNIVVSIGGKAQIGILGDNSESNNVVSTATVFVTNNPSAPADFIPSQGSPADNTAVPIDGLTEDFLGTARSQSSPDAGAFEN